ncbi:hypothetical protein CMV64_23410 [Escherichia coli]|nr:hypothetical protein CMV64_23410 [Escherichia coli]
MKKLLIDRPPESAKWQEASKFNFEEIANLRRRFHFLSAHPSEPKKAGGGRINFAAPASKKTRPRVGLFGGLPPTPSCLSLRPKAGSVARPPP